ncbi:MAG TPA: hypothetical protein VFN68_02380 [Acidimicrobiales bacterium]|nr:hypothetical protein [Acidimicrobiales bacterium]
MTVARADVCGMGSVPPQLRFEETIPVPGADVSVGTGAGGTYLVIELAGHDGPCWVCAPASERAVECVRTGRASPWSVVHHSLTGTVDIYRTAADGSLHMSVALCARLPGAQPHRAAA